ncbi:MAG TPA: tyrosine-protein phosphatase [Candidatus Hydrogenedentes bacterium]|nr:tyrosine-protein phosphatase [Candidatus Hydrogenedentota bacterium]
MFKTLLKVAVGVVLVPLLMLGGAITYYFAGYNFRVVERGAFYGSRQMSGRALERTIRSRGIRTVINLRGANPDAPWYQEELAVCRKHGVEHLDFAWSRNSIPSPESLAAYVDAVKNAPRPILAHCEGGTHRTGVASAIWLLLEGKSPAVARGQFGIMFRNAPIGRVVDLYEQHGNGMPFDQWVREIYPGLYQRRENLVSSPLRAPGSMVPTLAG